MSGPLCEAVLDEEGSSATLVALAQSNLLLVPLDRRGQWYRYHHMFRDMLLAELERQEPGLIPVLRQRAADWSLHNGLTEEALEYLMAAAAAGGAARRAEELWLPVYRRGRFATLKRWFQWLEEHGEIEKHPMLAVASSIICAITDRPAEAERWADVVDRWQSADGARADDPAADAWSGPNRVHPRAAWPGRHGGCQDVDTRDR
jgi:LuxR family maltose regulon positive regulatory protein